jgi:hypothetical protein
MGMDVIVPYVLWCCLFSRPAMRAICSGRLIGNERILRAELKQRSRCQCRHLLLVFRSRSRRSAYRLEAFTPRFGVSAGAHIAIKPMTVFPVEGSPDWQV